MYQLPFEWWHMAVIYSRGDKSCLYNVPRTPSWTALITGVNKDGRLWSVLSINPQLAAVKFLGLDHINHQVISNSYGVNLFTRRRFGNPADGGACLFMWVTPMIVGRKNTWDIVHTGMRGIPQALGEERGRYYRKISVLCFWMLYLKAVDESGASARANLLHDYNSCAIVLWYHMSYMTKELE